MNVKEIAGNLNAEGMKMCIVVSRFNDFLTKELLSGAIDCIIRHGGNEKNITVIWVPGANELPMAALKAAQSKTFNAIIGIGAVVQGATPHADLINAQVSRSLAKISMDSNIPVVNGVVTANTIEQAIERSGTKAGNKGWNAAMSAIEMSDLYRQLK